MAREEQIDNDSYGTQLQEIRDRLARLEEAFAATTVAKKVSLGPGAQKAASVAIEKTAGERTTIYAYTVDKDGNVVDDINPSAQPG